MFERTISTPGESKVGKCCATTRDLFGTPPNWTVLGPKSLHVFTGFIVKT
jgi:hypothetical protein